MIANVDRPDMSENALPNEATDRIDAVEPMLPMESAEPTLPMDRTLLLEPIDSTERRDPIASSESDDRWHHRDDMPTTVARPGGTSLAVR